METGLFSTISCRHYQIRRLVIHAIGVEKSWRDIRLSDVQMIDMLTAMENENGSKEREFK